MRQFEVYKRENDYGRGRRRPGKTVTVQSRGLMSFSDGAFAELGSPGAVRYLVSTGEMVIGFCSCEPGEQDSYAVRGRQHDVSAVMVLKYLGVNLGQSHRYALQVEDGLPPYIDLNEDAPAVTSNRRKRGSNDGS